jgi:hypothetical protein
MLADYTDFGATGAGCGDHLTRAYTLYNEGGDPIHLTGDKTALSGADAGDFTISLPPADDVIDTYAVTTFQVDFTPSALGTRRATLTITSDDPETPAYTFDIRGAGLPAPGNHVVDCKTAIVGGALETTLEFSQEIDPATLNGDTVWFDDLDQTPTQVSQFGGSFDSVAVVGSLAYVTDAGGLDIFDTSVPSAPVRLGGYDALPLSSKAGLVAIAHGIDVVGTIAYVAADGGGLQIIDVSDPHRPVWVGGCDSSHVWGSQSVQVVGTLAYVADMGSGLQIIDVSDPVSPAWMGGYDTSGYAYGVQVVGTLAYVADNEKGLLIIDVSRPGAPARVGGYDMNGYAHDVRVAGALAYVANDDGGLQIVDVLNPSAPVPIGQYGGSTFCAQSVEVVGDLAYVVEVPFMGNYPPGALHMADVSTPSAPVRVGICYPGSAETVRVVGSLAYLTDVNGDVQILDISNPVAPARVGGYDTNGYANGIEVRGDLAYIAAGDAGLEILDVSNPAAPALVGGYDTNGYAYDVEVVGSGITDIVVQTPWGEEFSLADLASASWDGAEDMDARRGALEVWAEA